MSRRSARLGGALRIGAAVVLAVVAVLAALLAADTRSWRSALDRGDAAFAVSPAHAKWTPSTHLGGLAGSILGVGDDVAMRRGIALYRQVASRQESLSNQLDVEALRARAERALARPARPGSSDPGLASQARTLTGILAFGASAKGGGGLSPADQAISDFTGAITTDPSDTAAKYNLELLLRLAAAGGSRHGSGPTNGFGRTGRQGAAGGAPGSGY